MLTFLRSSVTEFGQSIVMVTHDPRGAAFADRVVFLADGKLVDELVVPPPTRSSSACAPSEPEMGGSPYKGLLAHKLRLALTAIAIVLGVTFIAGTYILTDTLHNTFTNLFTNIYQNVDFEVRGVAQFPGQTALGCATPSPSRCSPRSASCPASPPLPARSPATPSSSPTPEGHRHRWRRHLGLSFDPDQQASPSCTSSGGPPTTAKDVVMDGDGGQVRLRRRPARAGAAHAAVPRTFTISGIARFGTVKNLAGATVAAFDLRTAQQVLGDEGKFDTINVVDAPGANRPRCSGALPRSCPRASRW